MKKLLCLLLLCAVALTLLACPETPSTPANEFDAAKLMSTFANKIETTVKLTYVTNYKVDVVRPGADASGMDSFKRDVVATAVVEMDLGTDLYIKVSKTRQDKLVDESAIKSEEIMYKQGDKYYYQTTSSTAVEVTDPAAKLAEIFETATYEQIGGLTLDALLYNAADKEYEMKVIALSDTFLTSELANPTYSEAPNGGLKVDYKPDYIGYRTDGGWSDFSNANGPAANVEILTNDKGYVTSMKETYNEASLVFNIMSNPPTVTITGERSFTASYGEAITKADSVELGASKAVYEQASGGTFTVMTCPNGQYTNLSPVENGGALAMGNIIAIKVTPNEGYEIAKVAVNGNTTPMIDPAQAGNFYCFQVAPGNNTIEVIFRAINPDAGIVTVKDNAGYGYQLMSFTYGASGPEGYKVITDGAIQSGASIFGAIVIDSTKEVSVYVNGVETTINIPNQGIVYYCFAVKAGGTYDVVITEKGSNPSAGTKGIVNVTNNTSYAYELQSFTYAGQPTNYQTITNNEIEPGAAIYGAIVISADTPVVVVVNGAATQINIPAGGVVYYCFAVKEAGEFNVEINPAQ